MTSTISEAVTTFSTNQPVRNCEVLACIKQKQNAEGQVITGGVRQAEYDHKAPNKLDIPSARPGHRLRVDAVAGMEQNDISRHYGFGLNFNRLAVALTGRLNMHHSRQLLHGIGGPTLKEC